MNLRGAGALLAVVLAAHPAAASGPDLGRFTPTGYVEGFFQYNLGAPSNGITHYRGFDNRHASFTLANVALGGDWERGAASARTVLQIGHTPNTYYLAEPSLPGAPGTSASNAETTWKYLQEAHVGYRIPIGRGLTVKAGLFLSPIGIEGMAVKDNGHFSRSNLFFGLPFYHTGVRATYPLSPRFKLTLAAYNGWNSVVDNNTEKSVSAQLAYENERLSGALLYFGGVERGEGAPEGRPFRHLVDAWARATWFDRLTLALHGDVGFEVNHFGRSGWAAAALYARLRAVGPVHLGARGDVFREWRARSARGEASAIFWPVPWMASGTFTVDVRPRDDLAVMLELRHDAAAGDVFFRGAVRGAGTPDDPFVPNARAQTSITLGATAWF
ncbi:outer membrane beta-barrel protein [Polyangium jinanense]|uniref:outer membrane beta-barrel protein n=1 Tax=Polyangium jinanense TaxID=2829994 RepID=UPI002341A5B8|nr:outer membrane beta-barrel protein [Polyangium jinanense]MDC3961279.1 outer membrane beta-barrel protein [Polyangium jinanense]